MSSSRCEGCKAMNQKCESECLFAPHFPAGDDRFADIHSVFGASNVGKILRNLEFSLRPEAAQSLSYAAKARLMDPVYGLVGAVCHMGDSVDRLRVNLQEEKQNLVRLVGSNEAEKMLANSSRRARYNFLRDQIERRRLRLPFDPNIMQQLLQLIQDNKARQPEIQAIPHIHQEEIQPQEENLDKFMNFDELWKRFEEMPQQQPDSRGEAGTSGTRADLHPP